MNILYKILDHIIRFIIAITILIIPLVICYYGLKLVVVNGVTSSPVEEMYHRQLVTTVDSILDARLTIEVIDSDDVTVRHDQFGKVILPDGY